MRIQHLVHSLILPLLVVALLGGCWGGEGDPDGATRPTTTSTPSSAPVLLSFGIDASTLTVGELLRVSAIVSDPDGMEDVVGGVLEDEFGVLYGTFEKTDAGLGTFELILSWWDIDKAQPITFDDEAGQTRTFVAHFFDTTGRGVTDQAQVQLHCNGLWASNGTCGLLRTGAYNVTELSVASETCGPHGYDMNETTVAVFAPDDIEMLGDVNVYQVGLTVKSTYIAYTDHAPLDCLTEDTTTFRGDVKGPGELVLMVKKEREAIFGSQCWMVALQAGITLPCKTEATLELIKP